MIKFILSKPLRLVLTIMATFLVVSPALAAQYQTRASTDAPTVSASAQDMGQHSARIDIKVNPHGSQTTYHVEYGIDTSGGIGVATPYGQQSKDFVSNGNEDVFTGITLEGLQLGTTYHYRLVATNDNGTTSTDDATFTTQPRLRPALTLHVSPNVARTRPYRFVSVGHLVRPSGISKAEGCSGKVKVRFKSGQNTISTRTVNIREDCSYRSTVKFSVLSRLRFDGTRLVVGATYVGNKALKSAKAKRTAVRYRR